MGISFTRSEGFNIILIPVPLFLQSSESREFIFSSIDYHFLVRQDNDLISAGDRTNSTARITFSVLNHITKRTATVISLPVTRHRQRPLAVSNAIFRRFNFLAAAANVLDWHSMARKTFLWMLCGGKATCTFIAEATDWDSSHHPRMCLAAAFSMPWGFFGSIMLHTILKMIITKDNNRDELSKLANDLASMQSFSNGRLYVELWAIPKKAQSARKLILLSDLLQCCTRECNPPWTEEGLVSRSLFGVESSSSLLSISFSSRSRYLMFGFILFWLEVVPVGPLWLLLIFSSIVLPTCWHSQREHLKHMVHRDRLHEHANGSMGSRDGTKLQRAAKWLSPY